MGIEKEATDIQQAHTNKIVKFGLWQQGIYKINTEKEPLISVVMPTYNREKFIEQSVQSVLAQSYKNRELIIIDGSSKDNTLNILRKYEHLIDIIVSEPDNGIFDAINKGTLLSRGLYSVFLGSDDLLLEDAIKIVKDAVISNNFPDFCFGDMYILKKTGEKRYKKSYWYNKGFNFSISHPALYIKKEVFKNLKGFDTKYKICSDADFELRLFKSYTNYIQLDIPLVIFREGGTTYLNPKKRKEAYLIFKQHNVLHFGYYITLIKSYILQHTVKIFGESFINTLLKKRNTWRNNNG